MKATRKLAGIPMLLLTILALVYPVATMAFGADGYSLTLDYPAVTMAAITVLTLILSLLAIPAKAGWFATLLSALLPAFTAINCLFFFAQFPSALTLVLAVVCMLSVIVASISCRQGVISCIVLILLALLPAAMAGYIGYHVMSDPIELNSSREVILELESPEGGYTAVVARSEDYYPDCGITLELNEEPVNFVIGHLERETKLIHMMAWEDFDLADLKWIDENTLMCDGNTYAISADGAELIEGAVDSLTEEFTESILEATETLVEATEALVEEAAASVAATEAPVEPTEAPVEVTEAPAEDTELAGAVVIEPAA